jgi:hypothetical protein
MRSQDFKAKKDFSGSSPAPFVGRFGYPNVNVGVLAPPEVKGDVTVYDDPRTWAAENYGVGQVASLRAGLVNSRFSAHIKRPDKYVEIAKEVGMASKPVDVDVELEKAPTARLNTDKWAAPTGPNAKLQTLEMTSNPKIHTRVQRAFDSEDILATETITDLFRRGFDENSLSRMLSVGVFGVQENRKLVPTRWSITATDDMLSKDLLREVKQNPESNYMAYFGGYSGNYYLILFFSHPWSYELFEMSVRTGMKGNWEGKGNWSTDYEPYKGRKYYAEDTVGGYYTVRLAISEKLKEMKRQSSVLALRFITDEYTIPLGVWVTREAARNALSSKPITFADDKLMITYAKHVAKNKFGFDLEPLLKSSRLLKERREQKRLFEFA